MERKTIGIIGGMGPLATCDLFEKIIKNTNAASDNEHIHIIIDNDTSIPDRTAAILNGGKSPLEALIKCGKNLEKSGADFIIMPCNASHYFYDDIQKQIKIPILNMIDATAEHLASIGIKCASLFAVNGTVKSGIYGKALSKHGISLVLPDETQQKEITDIIYNGIKAGKADWNTAEIHKIIAETQSRGSEITILGCTELPVAVKQYSIKGAFADPTEILAKAAIIKAGYRLKELAK